MKEDERKSQAGTLVGQIKKGEQLTVDHVIPKSRGGEKSWTNLVAACKKCNQKKGCRTPQECGMIPIRKPTKPKVTILKTATQVNDLWRNYLWE